MQYDLCNPEIEKNELDDEVMEPPKQKTPVAKPVENPHHVEGMLDLNIVHRRVVRSRRKTWRTGRHIFWQK